MTPPKEIVERITFTVWRSGNWPSNLAEEDEANRLVVIIQRKRKIQGLLVFLLISRQNCSNPRDFNSYHRWIQPWWRTKWKRPTPTKTVRLQEREIHSPRSRDLPQERRISKPRGGGKDRERSMNSLSPRLRGRWHSLTHTHTTTRASNAAQPRRRRERLLTSIAQSPRRGGTPIRDDRRDGMLWLQVCNLQGMSGRPRGRDVRPVRLAGKVPVWWLLVADLSWEKSTAGWWLISQTNKAVASEKKCGFFCWCVLPSSARLLPSSPRDLTTTLHSVQEQGETGSIGGQTGRAGTARH
jgi:hypothetical protein